MADIFDVVADGTRRRLLRSLLDRSRGGGEVSVSELVAELGLSQPTVSKHLKVLRDHGLVSVREEGQHRYYRIDSEPLAELEEWIAPFRGIRPGEPAPAALAAAAAEDGPSLVGDGPRPQDAAAVVLWEGAEAGARLVGRVAADAVHSARSAAQVAELRLATAQARLARSRRRAALGFSRLVDALPFGGRED